MTTQPSWTADGVEQAENLRRRGRSVAEVLGETIDRIERWDPAVNSVIHRLYERRDFREPIGGPLAGVPILVKDFGCQTAGDPYHEGMAALRRRGWTAPTDSVLAQRLRKAGMLIVGRTNTPELATSYTTEPAVYGPTRNPWDLARSAGGSSGGSAAAVALGLVAIAHGNDAGGSIRVPASSCGVIGLKPTRGRIPLHPHIEHHWAGLTHEGMITRSVRDAALALDCVSGGLRSEPYPSPVPLGHLATRPEAPPAPLRVGVRTTVPVERRAAHPECVAAVEKTASLLAAMGHEVTEEEMSDLDDPEFERANSIVFSVAVAAAVERWGVELEAEIRDDELEPRNRALARVGRSVSASEYVAALQLLQRRGAAILSRWSSAIDVLITPTMPELPPELGTLGQEPISDGPYLGRFTAPFNVTGQPAISLPLHWTSASLPVGVQLVGDVGSEDLLLGLAARLEEAVPWCRRRPASATQ